MSSEMAQRPNAADVLEVAYAQAGTVVPTLEAVEAVYTAYAATVSQFAELGILTTYSIRPTNLSLTGLVARHKDTEDYQNRTRHALRSERDVTHDEPFEAHSLETDMPPSEELAIVFSGYSKLARNIPYARWTLGIDRAGLGDIKMLEARNGVPVSRWTGAIAIPYAKHAELA